MIHFRLGSSGKPTDCVHHRPCGQGILIAVGPTGLIVADIAGPIAAGGLRDAERNQFLAGIAAPLEAVANDEAVRILLVDGVHHDLDDLRIRRSIDAGRFVEEVK